MNEFYVKNSKGEFIPLKLETVFGKNLLNNLTIISLGDRESLMTQDTVDSVIKALNSLSIFNEPEIPSVVIVPHRVKISIEDKDLSSKQIYIQIMRSDNISELDESIKVAYNEFLNKFGKEPIILPTPLTVKEYFMVRDTLERCRIRREKRRVKK